MVKKRSLNEYRQNKDYGYKKHYTIPKKPKTGIVIDDKTKLVSYEEKDLIVEIKKLHIDYPNDQEFGYNLRKYLKNVNII